MRERTHGQAGVDHPGPGEQHESWARSARRGATGPRPVRPAVPPGSARPESGHRPPAGLGGTGEAPLRRRAESAVDGGGSGATTDRGAGRTAAERWAVRVAAERGSGRAAVRRGIRPVGGEVPPVGGGVESVGAARPEVCRRAGRGAARIGRRTADHEPRILVRRPLPAAVAPMGRARRVVVGVALVLAAAAVVFGLGRVADAAAHARAVAAPSVAEVTVTVDAPGTVWEVADGVAPGTSGPERAAMVDRIVAANALTSVTVWPGEVLRVPLR